MSSFCEDHYYLELWKQESVRGGGWVGCVLVRRAQESKDLASKSETTIVCET